MSNPSPWYRLFLLFVFWQEKCEKISSSAKKSCYSTCVSGVEQPSETRHESGVPASRQYGSQGAQLRLPRQGLDAELLQSRGNGSCRVIMWPPFLFNCGDKITSSPQIRVTSVYQSHRATKNLYLNLLILKILPKCLLNSCLVKT